MIGNYLLWNSWELGVNSCALRFMCFWAGDKVGIGNKLDLMVWEGFSHLGLYITINTVDKSLFI